MAERFSFTLCVRERMCVKEKSEMPSRRIPKHKELDFPSPFFGLGEGKMGGLREKEVKAVLIETWPNQTHYHFYQFVPPKMLIR